MRLNKYILLPAVSMVATVLSSSWISECTEQVYVGDLKLRFEELEEEQKKEEEEFVNCLVMTFLPSTLVSVISREEPSRSSNIAVEYFETLPVRSVSRRRCEGDTGLAMTLKSSLESVLLSSEFQSILVLLYSSGGLQFSSAAGISQSTALR